MLYTKDVFIVAVDKTDPAYAAVMHAISDMPGDAVEGYCYKLTTEFEWVLVEMPPVLDAELTDSEALAILTGGVYGTEETE